MIERICEELQACVVLIQKGEFERALQSFITIATVIEFEDKSESQAVPFLLSLLWEEARLTIEHRYQDTALSTEYEMKEVIRYKRLGAHALHIIRESGCCIESERLVSECEMAEIAEYWEEVLRVRNGIDPYTPDFVRKLIASFGTAHQAHIPAWTKH